MGDNQIPFFQVAAPKPPISSTSPMEAQTNGAISSTQVEAKNIDPTELGR